MATSDYLIIFVYFSGLLLLGGLLGKKIKSSKEMFIAGRNSSWWLSGLSTYMTIFSAGTFVVWGGVAYRSGIVAIVVGVLLGIASILVGLFLAGKWAKLKINSPAEYLGIRFGKLTVRFYSIVLLIGRGIHTAVALYAIAVMMVVLMPLPENHFLADPNTGHLSISWAIAIMGIITIFYTGLGGFIAVLMTDIIQFAVLISIIIILVPLSLNYVGGIDTFISKAPEGFFDFVNSQYSWGWMILWLFLNFFMIGGDWPFVQRFISVPTSKDAKKSIFLVGFLYLLTPIIWYIPALVYRVINSDANPEQAYMLMSQKVLGVGLLGLFIAAMLSATMSMVSSTLNVFANVFTYDIFKKFRPLASEKILMKVGRIFTFSYGVIVTIIGIMIPYMGGAERVVVSILTLVISPLFIPSIWGLFSKRIGQKAVIFSMGTTYLFALLIKTGLLFNNFVMHHAEFVDAFIGLVFPVTILLIIELFLWKKGKDKGWVNYTKVIGREKDMIEDSESVINKKAGFMYSSLAFKLIFGTYAIIGVILLIIGLTNDITNGQLFYGSIFLAISALSFVLYYLIGIKKRKSINIKN